MTYTEEDTPPSQLSEEQPFDSIKQEAGKILAVDDDPLILSLLEQLLLQEGYEVITAADGNEAIEKLKKQDISLIICDQCMPNVSGIEVLKEVQLLQPDAIRILLTGHSDSELAINAINIGQVHHYITKPWDAANFRKMIKTSIERYNLVKENKILQKLIMKQHKKLAKTHEALRSELKFGSIIQEKLLLGKVPKELSSFDVAATSMPSKDIDGDFFDFYHPNSEVFDVVLGDVMGKGVPAAFVGMTVKTQLVRFANAFTLPKICEYRTPWKDDLLTPKEIINEVHNESTHQLQELEYFVTLFYGRFNLLNRSFTYLDCGSAKPIHYRKKKQQLELLQGENFPIGVIENTVYESKVTDYQQDDVFVFYSDGVTEAKAPDDSLFGIDRLKEIVKQHAESGTSEEILNAIKNSVLDYTKKKLLDDDLTIIVVKIKNAIQPHKKELNKASFSSELSQLDAVRAFIQRLCSRIPGDRDRIISRLELAINEAFCNIVLHGYDKDPRGEIIIEGKILEDGLTIEISDQGKSVDPSMIQEPNLAGNRFGGFGWYLIREIADRVRYSAKRSDTGWNHLQIYKKFVYEEDKMQLLHEKTEDVLIITPDSENLDARDAPEFKKQVIDLISNNGLNNVVIDLHQLQFIDSSGLGSFLSVLKTLNTQGGELKLSCMKSPIRTMFELVAMHKIFEIFNSNEEAIKSFKK